MISAPGSPNIRIAKNMVTLPPGTMTIRSGIDLDAVAAGHVGRHRLAQRQDAVRRRVAVMAVAQRLDRGLDDVRRRLEVGLADAEVDDATALALQVVARASTSKAVSVPRRCRLSTSCSMAFPPMVRAGLCVWLSCREECPWPVCSQGLDGDWPNDPVDLRRSKAVARHQLPVGLRPEVRLQRMVHCIGQPGIRLSKTECAEGRRLL